MLVELKNGETLNGHLSNCDNWMNLVLKEVVQTSPEGDRFFKLPEVYVRGNNVRLLSFVFDGYRLDLLSDWLAVCLATNPANCSTLFRSNTYGSPKKSSTSSRSSNTPATRVAAGVATEVMDETGVVEAVDAVGAEGEVETKERNVTIFSFFFPYVFCRRNGYERYPGERRRWL